MNIVDLSMPIETGHIRWPVERGKRGDFATGDVFEVSWLHTTCHGYTHVDAPSHMVPGGATLSDLDLSRVVNQCAVFDLQVDAEQEITAQMLAQASTGFRNLTNRTILLRSRWYTKEDYRTEQYWRNAPYINREACQWLLEQNPTAIAFDFPQDWSIRRLLDGVVLPIEEHVSHDVLLRNNVTLIEYLINTHEITEREPLLCAQPLSLPDSDGAPARVIAVEKLIG